RQIDAGNAFDATGLQQLGREIARRRAIDVREDEHAVAGVERGDELARSRQQVERVVAGANAQRLELRRANTEHVCHRANQAFTECVVRDNENADHGFSERPPRIAHLRPSCCDNRPSGAGSRYPPTVIFGVLIMLARASRRLRQGFDAGGNQLVRPLPPTSASKASAKDPATSKPVCLVISTNPVGLVTLTSVRKSPMTSSPTTNNPSAASFGPMLSAISRSRSVSGRATPNPPTARL